MRLQRVGQKIITIGNPGLSVISPRGGAAILWYLAGGVNAANCIAAYQPIGAADYAASKVNLANPGTYNATDGAAYPTWDDTNGWKFAAASSQYLRSGVTPNSLDWSAIVRVSNLPTATSDTWAFGYYTTQGFGVQPFYYTGSGNKQSVYYNGALKSIVADRTSGVFAFAKNQAYYNGSADGTTWTQTAHTAAEIYIGDVNFSGGHRYFNAYIQALALYNATLTSDQVSAITTAMNTL